MFIQNDFNEQMGANYSKFAISHQITFGDGAIIFRRVPAIKFEDGYLIHTKLVRIHRKSKI